MADASRSHRRNSPADRRSSRVDAISIYHPSIVIGPTPPDFAGPITRSLSERFHTPDSDCGLERLEGRIVDKSPDNRFDRPCGLKAMEQEIVGVESCGEDGSTLQAEFPGSQGYALDSYDYKCSLQELGELVSRLFGRFNDLPDSHLYLIDKGLVGHKVQVVVDNEDAPVE